MTQAPDGFRLIRDGALLRLVCTRCTPSARDPLDVLFNDVGERTRTYVRSLSARHGDACHPPTIAGRLADAPPGWHPLLVRLHEQLRALHPGYRICRLAAEDGELAVDLDTGARPGMRDAIAAAGAEARGTCEYCGTTPAWLADPASAHTTRRRVSCPAHGGHPRCPDDRLVILGNLKTRTLSAPAGARCYLIRPNPGYDHDRVMVLIRARNGRWTAKWMRIANLHNWRTKTLPPEHRLYKDARLWDHPHDLVGLAAELNAAHLRHTGNGLVLATSTRPPTTPPEGDDEL